LKFKIKAVCGSENESHNWAAIFLTAAYLFPIDNYHPISSPSILPAFLFQEKYNGLDYSIFLDVQDVDYPKSGPIKSRISSRSEARRLIEIL